MPVRGTRVSEFTPQRPKFWCVDCVAGARRELQDGCVDLIVTDPPYGIDGDTLHKHYNRKERFVIDGYTEVSRKDYADFSRRWIREAARVLRPGGSLYVLSGYTNLLDVLAALRESGLREVNHIVWKYNFGVWTETKYVSSHYHILYYEKPGGPRTFHQFSRFCSQERNDAGGSLLYQDLEDVWSIKREYKPGQTKNKNELPRALLAKILQYSSDPEDVVCDFFLGSFATAKVAKGMGRSAIGFEINRAAFKHQERQVEKIEVGSMLPSLREGRDDTPRKKGEPWSRELLDDLAARFRAHRRAGCNKKKAMEFLQEEFERGRFSILKALERRGL
ncbi:MAG: site-specific DNA-methyltransferase [Planctomycetes bacterium]|nr:site-specific DNA-methyltransferase [Planctomycetota bacterium]